MNIAEINEENIFRYAEKLPRELVNDMGREYTRGLVGENETTYDAEAMVIWAFKNVEDEKAPTTAEILWLYLSDEAAGKELIGAFIEKAANDGAEKACFEFEEAKEAETAALKAAGFEITDSESRDVCVTVGELAALGINRKDKKPPDYVKSLSDIDARQFKSGIMSCTFHERYGLNDDLPFLPMTRFDPDVSSCVITDGKVNGFILIHKTAEGDYIVELLFAVQPDADKNLLNMMRRSIAAAESFCDQDDTVILRRHNPIARALVGKLFPGKKGRAVMKGEISL